MGSKMKICPRCSKDHDKQGTFCSRKCANSRIFTDESNRKRSISVKKSHVKREQDIVDLIKRNISDAMIESHKRRGFIQLFCISCGKKISKNKHKMCGDCYYESPLSSEARGHHNKNYMREYVIDSYGSDVLLMSSLEITYFKYLSKNNIKWKKAKIIKYIDHSGKERRYKPDFHLIENDEIIEIKGYWWNNDRIKMQCVIDQHPELKIKILMNDDIELLGG